MSSKGRNVIRLETEIESSREDSKWLRVIELAEQLKQGSPNQEALADFLLGEGKLESYLEEHPPIEENIRNAQEGLKDAKGFLLNSTSDDGKKARVALDSNLLLGKLSYACGKYEDAVQYYNNAELDTLTEKELPCRGLKIVAESYAIKGLCMARITPSTSSKFKTSEREATISKCFELAAGLTLLYLQELDRLALQQQQMSTTGTGTHSPTPVGGSTPHPANSSGSKMGIILETALQRAPLQHVQAGRLDKAVMQYRRLLSAVESSGTHAHRIQFAQQLAEVLMRGLTGMQYGAPTTNSKGSLKIPHSGESPWKPRQYANLNMFVPVTDQEEIVLLLLIAEEMAVRDAVLSQAADFQLARRRALNVASTIYDLLAIATVRWKQASLINELLERAMKFSFREAHIWMQRALCLISMGKHFQGPSISESGLRLSPITHFSDLRLYLMNNDVEPINNQLERKKFRGPIQSFYRRIIMFGNGQALAVLRDISQLNPEKTYPCLLASRICYEFLERAKEGVEWADEALKREKARGIDGNEQLLSRCYLYKGIGLHLLAQNTSVKAQKDQLHQEAYEVFITAQQTDPNDHLCEFYLALNLSCQALVSEAITHARIALGLCSEHSPTLQLLTLLLTAQRQFTEAMQVIDAASSEYPDDLHIMNIKVHVELLCDEPQSALLTAKKMLAVWKTEYENQTISENSDNSDKRSETRSVFQLYSTQMSDKDTGSLHAQSIAASRVEHALSEVASSLSSFVPRPGPQQAWLLQAQIWLLICQVYLELGEITSADACCHEASLIFPLSHQVLHMRGEIHLAKNEIAEAKQWFQNAVAVCPWHVRSLQELGIAYHRLGSLRLAEKTLFDAARLDPSSHQTWHALGHVREMLNEHDSAAACMATALDVEKTTPILPYSTIPIPFH